MDIVDVALIAAGLGTLGSLVLIFDAVADIRAAGDDPDLQRPTHFHLVSETLRFLAQSAFLVAALLAKFRVPGTFANTIRYLLVAVPILLAIGSATSWYSKRRLLRDAGSYPRVEP